MVTDSQSTARIRVHQVEGWTLRHDESLAAEARADGWWLDTTLGVEAARLAQDDPERVLIVDGAVRLNAATLFDQASRLARSLVERGLKPGQVVSFMLPNWHEAAVIYLGASLAGLVVHPLVTAYREAELSFLLADSASRMIFIPRTLRNQGVLDMVRRACAGLDTPPEIILVRDQLEGVSAYGELLTSSPTTPLPQVNPDAVRMILYTSGTTGRPKGVLHTHNSLNAAVAQLNRDWVGDQPATFLVPSPISHIGGSIYAFEFPLLFGCRAVLQDSWDAATAVDLIEAEGCTHMAGATPFLQQLLDAATAKGTTLPSLRVFVCGGASVPPSLIRRGAEVFHQARVMRVYGLTEVPTITTGVASRKDLSFASETDGQIGIADVRLIDEGGKYHSTHGQVAVRGAQMFVGYLHPQDNDGAFDDRGYYLTGDIADRVSGTYLRISGRAKDIIIRQGENISPKEVEDLLVGHPDIADVAIVGLPSEKTGELACAVIVPRPGKSLGVPDLRDFLEAKRLAKFKMPEKVVLTDSLPRNAMGKVLKVDLRKHLLEQGA